MSGSVWRTLPVRMRLFSALWVALLLAASLLPAQESRDIAFVLKATGTVQVNKTENGAWVAAPKGTRLHAGNAVRTGNNSLASIVFSDDKSLLKVRSQSRVVIRGKRTGNQVEKTLLMQLGELWSRVTSGSIFRIETPSGVAAVKGTEFYSIENGTILVIYNISGVVELANRLGRLDINPGERGEISRDRPPTKRPIAPGELPTWGSEDQEIELKFGFEHEDGEKKTVTVKLKKQ